jgi:hypothetical protein
MTAMTPEEIERVRVLYEENDLDQGTIAAQMRFRKQAIGEVIFVHGFVRRGRVRVQADAFRKRPWVNLAGYYAGAEIKICALSANRVRHLTRFVKDPLPLPASPAAPHRIVARALEPVLEGAIGADASAKAMADWMTQIVTEWSKQKAGCFLLAGASEQLTRKLAACVSKSNWPVLTCELPEFSRRVANILSDFRLEKLGAGNFPSRVRLMDKLVEGQSRWVLSVRDATRDFAEEEVVMRAMARDGMVLPGPSSRIASGREVTLVDGSGGHRVVYEPPLKAGLNSSSPKLVAPSVLAPDFIEVLEPEQIEALRHNDWQSLPKDFVGWATSKEFPDGILVARLPSMLGMLYGAMRKHPPRIDSAGLSHGAKVLSKLPAGPVREVIDGLATALLYAARRWRSQSPGPLASGSFPELVQRAGRTSRLAHDIKSGFFIRYVQRLLLQDEISEEWLQRVVVATMLMLVDADTLLRQLAPRDIKKAAGWRDQWIQAVRIALTESESKARKAKDQRTQFDDSTIPQDAVDRFAEGHVGFPRIVLEALYVQMSVRFKGVIRAGRHRLSLTQLIRAPLEFLRDVDPQWPVIGISRRSLASQFLRYKRYVRRRMPDETQEEQPPSSKSSRVQSPDDRGEFVDASEQPVELHEAFCGAVTAFGKAPSERIRKFVSSMVEGVAEHTLVGPIYEMPELSKAETNELNVILREVAEQAGDADFEKAEARILPTIMEIHARLQAKARASGDGSGEQTPRSS